MFPLPSGVRFPSLKTIAGPSPCSTLRKAILWVIPQISLFFCKKD
uniref:Uncharacterized protein n=1 Tax=Podoviridae sp. ctuQh21 TaxID=2825284 RepID=A0A8S5PGG7_9CAUD|nr:MAG TPA: hypothetical protein [Podoviridae sp. ctuQh21]DAT13972.1 MAG TPA: hypothetical protein [Caudoviricetes sp.]DAT30078.1 MAG TPA: hypothetical protein [Caudoviricetes sp.]